MEVRKTAWGFLLEEKIKLNKVCVTAFDVGLEEATRLYSQGEGKYWFTERCLRKDVRVLERWPSWFVVCCIQGVLIMYHILFAQANIGGYASARMCVFACAHTHTHCLQISFFK